MHESGFIYIWRDRKHNRYYIGAHWGSQNDSYICSSPWMKNAYNRRPLDFKRRILVEDISTKIEMFEKEQQILNKINLDQLGKRYYNLSARRGLHWSAQSDAAAIAKRSGLKRRGIKLGPHSQEVRDKISQATRGKKKTLTPESTAWKKGRILSEDHKQKISEGLKRVQTPELIIQRSQKNRGQRRKINLCSICNEDTLSPRRKYCDQHRYKGMNVTRMQLPGSKWNK